MGGDENSNYIPFNVGDIVRESTLIIPPDRAPWTGIVVYVDRMVFELHSALGPFEDLIAIHWFQAGYIESLPASVIVMVQRAEKT